MKKRNRRKHVIAFSLALALGCGQMMSVSADEIQDQIDQATAERDSSQAEQASLMASISDMETQKQEIADQMGDVDIQLVETIASINSLDAQIAEKSQQLEVTAQNLAVAQEQKDTEYAAMKKRIQYLYEKGGDTGWAMVLADEGEIADYLNQEEYVQKLYDYDRECLEAYVDTVAQVEELQTQLTQEQAELQTYRNEQSEEQLSLESQLEQLRLTSDNYEQEIAKANEIAVQYAQLIQEQNDKIQALAAEQERQRQEAAAAAAAQQAAVQQAAAQQAAAQQAAAQQAAAQQAASQQSSSSNSSGSTSASTNNTYDYSSIPIRQGGYSYTYDAASYALPGNTLGEQVVNCALQYVGNPYVYGGNSLTNGTDCSGFIKLVYQQFGISLSRSSYGMRSNGYAVPYSEAQAGDIICYDGHVALYIGNGAIVHASTESVGIIISYNAAYRQILSVRRVC